MKIIMFSLFAKCYVLLEIMFNIALQFDRKDGRMDEILPMFFQVFEK